MIYIHSLILSVTSLTSFQGTDFSVFLNPYFKMNEFGLSSATMSGTYMQKKLSLLIFTGLLNPLHLYDFLFIILSLSWYQQHYSSAWRILSGTSAVMAILWNYLRDLSHYMLRVGWGRRWRLTLIYWQTSKANFWWTRISRQGFINLLLNTISVSFIVSICTWHI